MKIQGSRGNWVLERFRETNGYTCQECGEWSPVGNRMILINCDCDSERSLFVEKWCGKPMKDDGNMTALNMRKDLDDIIRNRIIDLGQFVAMHKGLDNKGMGDLGDIIIAQEPEQYILDSIRRGRKWEEVPGLRKLMAAAAKEVQKKLKRKKHDISKKDK